MFQFPGFPSHSYVFTIRYLDITLSEFPHSEILIKQWGWKGNEVKYLFVLSCIPILALLRISGIAVIIAWYVLLSAMVAKKPAPQHH